MFSVIIAAYNAAGTIAHTLDSVLAQRYNDFEIIVVDDGSVDNTKIIINRYGDKVRYFFQENSGVSAARNHGAVMARGAWLCFLDADDCYYPDRLLRQAQLLSRYPALDFCIGDYHLAYSDGKIHKRSMSSSEWGLGLLAHADVYGCYRLEGKALGQLCAGYFGHTSTFSVPRQIFLKLGGYSEAYSVGEDLHLLIRLCAVSLTAGVDCEPQAVYYLHDKGLIRSDTLNAQIKTVDTLSSLKPMLKVAPEPIKHGFIQVLINARFDLAVALLRKGRRWQALIACFPILAERFNGDSIKLFLSIVKG
jgi:glycosyltransferase involved in cell wall biosynthesis